MTGSARDHALAQLEGGLFLTDGGLETTLIFHDGLELPHFAAFDLLARDEGRAALRGYYESYVTIALEHTVGIVLESATWRASPDWAALLGYSAEGLAELNRAAIDLLAEIRDEYATDRTPIVISGCVGPRGDGYAPDSHLDAAEAERYHAVQIGTFGETPAELVTATTMTYPDEAIGVTRGAQAVGLPVVISFTVETDGRLPSGHGLAEAIEVVDEETDSAPAYYMINCAHPTHFQEVLDQAGPWSRVRGLRANASTRSHAELDEAEELDDGDPVDLAQRYLGLRERLPELVVLGGCCGTDDRHIRAMSEVWLREAR
jgi:homocysteine S-methyltransferase